MGTVVDATIPTDQFALCDTFDRVPDAEFVAVRVATHRPDQLLPYLWGSAPAAVDLTAVLRDDTTTESVQELSSGDDRSLYLVEWAAHVRLVVRALVEEHGTLVDVHGRDGWWTVRVLFDDRDAVSATYEYCRDHGVDLSIHRVNGVTGSSYRTRSGLSEEQYEALVAAFEHEYFDVPRGMTLEALAGEMDVSHQALSERLRRGHQALISNTLYAPSDGISGDL